MAAVPPSAPLTRREIETRFKGVLADRIAWPCDELVADLSPTAQSEIEDVGLVSARGYDQVLGYFRGVPRRTHVFFLYIAVLTQQDRLGEIHPPDVMEFCGYDYGYYEGAWNHFSAVHNDVIFGGYPPLTAYGAALNEHLLLPSLGEVQALDYRRRQLVCEGAELERDNPFVPIAVFSGLARG